MADEYFNPILSQQRVGHFFSGMILVYHKGEVIYEQGFGNADNDANPITPGSLFKVGSLTKPITATTAMVLVQQGKLKLDDPVSEYLSRHSRELPSDYGPTPASAHFRHSC